MHSNDKYFFGSDGFSKNRESVVIDTNANHEVALVKLTTSQNSKYKDVPNYVGSKYMTEDLYIKDNNNKNIVVSNKRVIDNENKFIKSNFKDIPIESVEVIKHDLLNNSKYGKRNRDRLNKLKKGS